MNMTTTKIAADRSEAVSVSTDDVSQLWDHLETHHGPTLTAAHYRTLRDLDAAAIDGTLTAARYNRAKAALLAIPRSYEVDHATGRVDPAYWNLEPRGPEETQTPLERRKMLDKKNPITRKGRLHVVTLGQGESRTECSFKNLKEAHLYRDSEREVRKTEATQRKSIWLAPDKAAEEQRILTAEDQKAEARRELIRRKQKDHPELSWSAILRLPEIDLSDEPRIRGVLHRV